MAQYTVAVILACLYVTCCVAQLFPPKFKPGEIMKKTDFDSVNLALDEVLQAGSVILEGRRCAVGIANLDAERELTNPSWYVDSGKMYSSAPYTIPARQTGLNLFVKRQAYTFGSTGILSYNIDGTDHKVVVLWQVPWNTVLYEILFNVKVYPKTVPTDKAMFKQMMDYSGNRPSFGWLEKEEYGIKVAGTITDNTSGKLYVSVDATDYDVSKGPELHGECARNYLNPTWLGNYCWKECVPKGYCWINQKCDSDADCVGPLVCYNSC